MAGLYFIAGINHFIMPKFYLKIIPPSLPYPKALNYISGLAEIVLAIMLVYPPTTKLAAWGIIALLIAIFPANVYHYQLAKQKWILYGRLPFQLVFILWAWWYTF